MVLHEGKIAEMQTGEGKTLVATLPLYLNALTGNGVSELSQVGILAAPLIIEIPGNLLKSDSSGQRTLTRRVAIVTQGSKGLKVAGTGGADVPPQQVGRLSWRQLNNYRENKNN